MTRQWRNLTSRFFTGSSREDVVAIEEEYKQKNTIVTYLIRERTSDRCTIEACAFVMEMRMTNLGRREIDHP